MRKQILTISFISYIFLLTFNVISQPIREKNEPENIIIRNVNFFGNNAIETKLLNTVLGVSQGQRFNQSQL